MGKHGHLRKCLGKAAMPNLLLLPGSWIAEHRACICKYVRTGCSYVCGVCPYKYSGDHLTPLLEQQQSEKHQAL